MAFRSISDVASELDISPQRVRVLAKRGLIDAAKVGNRWLVKDIGARRSHPGRPLSAANAWAVLALLSGEDPAWVVPSVRSRLRRRMREPGWLARAIASSQPRASVEKLRVLPGDLKRLEGRSPVRSGLSADFPEYDLRPESGSLDAYVSRRDYESIDERFRPLADAARPNLILRIPEQDWVLRRADRAPLAVAAADLLNADDPRVRRSARDLISKLSE